MDNTILIIMGIVGGAIALAAIVSWLKKRGYVDTEDLTFVAALFSITLQIIDELDLKNENQIKQIGEIVYDGLQFAAAIMDDDMDIEEAENYAYNYSIEVCESVGIQVTEERKKIIRALVEIGITNNVVQL